MTQPLPREPIRDVLRAPESETDPLGFNTTALVSRPERRRLRAGGYRVVYTIDDGELVVWVGIGPLSTGPDEGADSKEPPPPSDLHVCHVSDVVSSQPLSR